MSTEYADLEKEINLDDIDFSDLEEKLDVDVGLDNFIVVDGAPVAPEAKVPLLTNFIKKKLLTVGELVDGDEAIHMPIEDGKSKGFLFAQFKTAEGADAAIKQLNNKPLDKNHTLKINKLADVGKYCTEGRVPAEFQEPEVAPFKSHGYLKSWLQDDQGRDQMALHFSDNVGIYWHKKQQKEPQEVCAPRNNFTSKYAKFSPKGTYLISIHPQGIKTWGGAEMESIHKFFHNQVRLVDFSPNEKYMVTLSPVPITLPENDAELANFPFGPESEGHKLVIWDLATGEAARTFALPPHLEGQKEMPWPLVKWSYDDKYCARQGPGAIAVYETENFQLLDKKLVKIDGIVDFEWSPAPVHLATSKSQEGEHVLSYWTPETQNQTARVALMQIPSREVLRTVNLHQVSDCKMHWQSEGRFLCVKVDRHTKSGKTIFTNLEFFKTTEKAIPVEKLELKDVVINFAWEPKSERFITISRLDDGNNNPAIAKNVVTFYAAESTLGKKTALASTFKAVKKVTDKHSNTVLWAPNGRYVAIATISRTSGEIEFYDTSFEDDKAKLKKEAQVVKLLKTEKYSGLTNLAWDPSGRFLAGWSSLWLHAIENGYRIFEFTGKMLRDESVDQFRELIWRPRPELMLTTADKKKVRANLREYSATFEENDAMEADAAVREAILARRKALEEWRKYRAQYADRTVKTSDVKAEIIEEIKEEIIEEKEEIVE